MAEQRVSYAPTEDQELIRSTAAQFLDDRAPMAKVRETMLSDDGFDDLLWKEMAEMGWTGLAVGESHGGSGLGPVELGVLLEEMGKRVIGGPFFSSSVLGSGILSALPSSQSTSDLLQAVAGGDVIVAPAIFESSWDWAAPSTVARRDGDGWAVTGEKSAVIYGHVADVILVWAGTDTGVGLFAIDADSEGLSVSQQPVLDLTRRQATVSLDDVRVGDDRRLDGGAAASALETAMRLGAVALAAEQVGGAQACMEMSVEYAKTRHQFGRPIGSYQAIKHRCANMLLRVEQARSAVLYAERVAHDPEELAIAAPMAASLASEAYTWIASETIQVHGGIGFTWEHDAHIYLKRAKASSLILGSPHHHRDHMGRALGI